jgi:hypothetical protein
MVIRDIPVVVYSSPHHAIQHDTFDRAIHANPAHHSQCGQNGREGKESHSVAEQNVSQ